MAFESLSQLSSNTMESESELGDMSLMSWPQLVGKTFQEASEAIRRNNSSLLIERVTDSSILTMDYRMDRVRVFVDGSGVVAKIPKLG